MSTNFLELARLAIDDVWDLALNLVGRGSRWGVALPVTDDHWDDHWDDETCKDRILEAQALFGRDPRAGLQAYAALADQGSVWCMIRVGWCHETGKGTRKDVAKAKEYYTAAFARGSDEAGLRLAQLPLLTGFYG